MSDLELLEGSVKKAAEVQHYGLITYGIKGQEKVTNHQEDACNM